MTAKKRKLTPKQLVKLKYPRAWLCDSRICLGGQSGYCVHFIFGREINGTGETSGLAWADAARRL